MRQKEEHQKQKKSYTKRDVARIVMLLAGVILLLVAGGNLCSILLEYKEGEDEYKALQELVFLPPEESTSREDSLRDNVTADDSSEVLEQDAINGDGLRENTENEQTVTSENESPQIVTKEQIMQAIRALKEQNEDVIGWISFDNLDISYPIMQGEDNNEYLRHTFSKKYNSAGSIIMEAENASDFEDCHTIIYGHNMRNLSMFGKLKYYKNSGFYDDHQYFTIYTEENVYRYQIFAYYDISETGDIYTIGFEHDDEFGEFVNNMVARSYYDTGVGVNETDKVITLSTCTTADENRFVVNAKRVEAYSPL